KSVSQIILLTCREKAFAVLPGRRLTVTNWRPEKTYARTGSALHSVILEAVAAIQSRLAPPSPATSADRRWCDAIFLRTWRPVCSTATNGRYMLRPHARSRE